MAHFRTLIIHAGGGKAGSSAVQSTLARATDALSKVGVTYANAPATSSAYTVTSGNGLFLYEKIAGTNWSLNGPSIIESYLAENPIGICSSEFLGSMSQSCWRMLLDTAANLQVDVKVVYFVRSAVGYLMASYNQDVKRAGEHRPLEEAVRNASWQHLDDLRTIGAIFEKEHLRIVNYDLVRGDMVGAFVKANPELARAEDCLRNLENITVNRSLTHTEIELMREVNARFGLKYSQAVSDRLIYENPELKCGLELNQETIDILCGRFEDGTSWINSQFFPDGRSALEFGLGTAHAFEGEDDAARTFKIGFQWALEQISSDSDELMVVRDALLGIDWHNLSHPIIPPDFDPIAYLLVNVDVLRAGSKPYIHYIQSGHAEGREYRWPLRLDASSTETIADAIARLRLEDGQDWSASPLWPRLRHTLQLEGLVHGFALREREYLNDIRKLRDRNYEGEEFRQRIKSLLTPLYELLVEVRQQANGANEQRVSEVRLLDEAIRRQAKALEATVGDSYSHVAKVGEEMRSQIAALGEDQSRMNAALNRMDAELKEKDAELERYRRMGIFDFLRSRR